VLHSFFGKPMRLDDGQSMQGTPKRGTLSLCEAHSLSPAQHLLIFIDDRFWFSSDQFTHLKMLLGSLRSLVCVQGIHPRISLVQLKQFEFVLFARLCVLEVIKRGLIDFDRRTKRKSHRFESLRLMAALVCMSIVLARVTSFISLKDGLCLLFVC
jgi:hypothetical protein